MDTAIQRPLQVIQELFDKNWTKEHQPGQDFGVAPHFQKLFDTREKTQKIPFLDNSSLASLPSNSLVRFRCMVQDTEWGTHFGLLATATVETPNGEEKLICNRYTDGGPQVSASVLSSSDQQFVDQRTSFYCVSIPGETEWSLALSGAPSPLERVTDAMSLEAKEPVATTIPKKFPIQGASHFAAVVQTHELDPELRVADMVEVIGVLESKSTETVDFTESSELDEVSVLAQEFNHDVADVPILHAILFRKLEDHGHPSFGTSGVPDDVLLSKVSQSASETRKELLAYLATGLGGDQLAAELVLLHLLARIYNRGNGLALGKLSLNLVDPSSESLVYKNLSIILRNILPKLHTIPLTLDILNNAAFFPRGEDHLLAGILQATPGTAFLLDETAMDEGTLQEAGIQNLKALAGVTKDQTLGYVFPFCNMDFATDLSVMVVSNGKSLLPVDCQLLLKKSNNDTPAAKPDSCLVAFRDYISSLRHTKYNLSEDIAKEIEADFIAGRKAPNTAGKPFMTPDELAFNVSLARLLAVSHGQISLSTDTWKSALDLAAAIKARNAGLKTAAPSSA